METQTFNPNAKHCHHGVHLLKRCTACTGLPALDLQTEREIQEDVDRMLPTKCNPHGNDKKTCKSCKQLRAILSYVELRLLGVDPEGD
jgi:hypothetical protein